MLRTKNLVPSVYYDYSRDFQFLGRTLDVIFNYLKMNIDLVSGCPSGENLDDKLIPLLAKTVGFDAKHNYNIQDLKSICSVFVELVRNKGSLDSIEKACQTLMNSQNISGYFLPKVINRDIHTPYTLKIYIPAELTDTILLEDLFDYILPAGYDYRFIKSVMSQESPINAVDVNSKLKTFKLDNDNIGKIAKPNDNIARPDMIDVPDGTIDTTSEIATIFTGKIISGSEGE